MTNCPSPADLTELVSPVSRLAMVMVALGTTAPEGSVTVPTMVASCANALHVSNVNSAQIAKIQCKRGPAFAARRLLNTLNCVMRSSCQSLLWSSKLDGRRDSFRDNPRPVALASWKLLVLVCDGNKAKILPKPRLVALSHSGLWSQSAKCCSSSPDASSPRRTTRIETCRNLLEIPSLGSFRPIWPGLNDPAKAPKPPDFSPWNGRGNHAFLRFFGFRHSIALLLGVKRLS